MAPGGSRRPLPRAVWKEISADLCLRGHKLMAVAALLGAGAYFRPRELMTAQPEDLAPPTRDASHHWSPAICPQTRGVTTKTGARDDSVILDCKWQHWAAPLWAALEGAARGKPVWTFTYPELGKQFEDACSRLGVPAVPYMMRRSGPSIDREQQFGPLDEVRKRGRWASHKSVSRYEKEARLTESWNHLPLHTRVLLEACESHLEDVLYNRRHGLALP